MLRIPFNRTINYYIQIAQIFVFPPQKYRFLIDSKILCREKDCSFITFYHSNIYLGSTSVYMPNFWEGKIMGKNSYPLLGETMPGVRDSGRKINIWSTNHSALKKYAKRNRNCSMQFIWWFIGAPNVAFLPLYLSTTS